MADWKNYADLCAEYGADPDSGRYPSPGKYEGESMLAVYFHAASGDGCDECLSSMEDGAGEYVALVEVSDEDRAFFAGSPLAIEEAAAFAVVSESDQGFVDCYLCTADEADALRAEYESAADDEESDEAAGEESGEWAGAR